MDLAYAVVRGEPPLVYAAEDVQVLQWVVALEVVARTPASTFPTEIVQRLRKALLEERWGDAVGLWMRTSGTVIDVYPDGLRVWTAGAIQRTSPTSASSSLHCSATDAPVTVAGQDGVFTKADRGSQEGTRRPNTGATPSGRTSVSA